MVFTAMTFSNAFWWLNSLRFDKIPRFVKGDPSDNMVALVQVTIFTRTNDPAHQRIYASSAQTPPI